jgi:hypothetical protein
LNFASRFIDVATPFVGGIMMAYTDFRTGHAQSLFSVSITNFINYTTALVPAGPPVFAAAFPEQFDARLALPEALSPTAILHADASFVQLAASAITATAIAFVTA